MAGVNGFVFGWSGPFEDVMLEWRQAKRVQAMRISKARAALIEQQRQRPWVEAEVCMLRNSKKARMIRMVIPKVSEKQNNEMKSESWARA